MKAGKSQKRHLKIKVLKLNRDLQVFKKAYKTALILIFHLTMCHQNNNQITVMHIPQKTKGIALVQTLFALALGSTISVGIASFYQNKANTQRSAVQVAEIVKTSEKTGQASQIGIADNKELMIDNINVKSSQGKTILTSMTLAQCKSLESALQSFGSVDATCLNNNASTISFKTNSIVLAAQNDITFAMGISEGGATNVLPPPSLDGNLAASGLIPAEGSILNSFSSNGGTTDANYAPLKDGDKGTVTSGITSTAPSAGSPPIYTGASTMSCRYRLNDTIYNTVSIGSRSTPCGAGQVSVVDQTGQRSYSCPSPTAATNPIGTDTWSGGSCALTCASRLGTGSFVTTSLGTRATSCPAGQVSTSNQTGTKTWTCGASGAAAVNPTSIDTWTGGSCAPTCNTRLGTGTFVTTSLGQRATSCPAGQQSTSNQTGTRTWSCGANGANAVDPTNSDAWTGGSCGVTCVVAPRQTQDIGCPANQIGSQLQYRDSYCPAPTGSAAWTGWTTYSNTCAWNTSCQGYGSNYAWNGSSCQITCASVKPADTYLGTRPTSCPAGQTSSANQVGYKRYSCPTTFGGVSSFDDWTGGGCVSNEPVLGFTCGFSGSNIGFSQALSQGANTCDQGGMLHIFAGGIQTLYPIYSVSGVPASGFTVSWSGGCSGNSTTCTGPGISVGVSNYKQATATATVRNLSSGKVTTQTVTAYVTSCGIRNYVTGKTTLCP